MVMMMAVVAMVGVVVRHGRRLRRAAGVVKGLLLRR
jgi:hypothetical protein